MDFTTDRGIHVEVRGNGPPVLLLHSFWCDTVMWRSQVEALCDSYRVINMDFRGHGASGRVRHAYQIDDLIDDAFGVLDHLSLQAAIWAGLSVGGMVTMRAALRDPSKVQAMVLIATDAEPFPLGTRLQYRMLCQLARLIGIRPFVGKVTRAMFGPTSFAERTELVAEWRRRFAMVDGLSMVHMLGALIGRGSILEQLAEVSCPALVIGGVEDRSIEIARTRRVAEALPQASMLELVRAGHLCCLERPDAVSEAMREFLDGICELKGAKTLGAI